MANCKTCIHFSLCDYNTNISIDMPKVNLFFDEGAEKCTFFKDKTRNIELPCKIGDTVYLKLNGISEILKGDIRRMSFNRKNELIICIGRWQGTFYTTGNHKLSSFGKTVFLTREEAEKVLKEMRYDKNE